MINIVMGPIGCGKTFNSKLLKEHFKAKRVVDGWWPDHGIELKDGDLVLTSWWPMASELDKVPGQLHNFSEVMKKIKKKGVKNVEA